LFESWILPMAIITTIPMAMAGAFWGLYLTDTDMDTMAGIGLVVLVGVVVNNGIVLVDFITQLRGEGMERSEAIREACQRRLRPILMTAVTTITGLVPMAMGSSDFIGIPYAPLGRTVIGGLTAATALTLLFVPYMYVLLDDLRELGVHAGQRADDVLGDAVGAHVPLERLE
ncbi:MAG: efflux RND transporter permease subunit, partial [Myxococcales bacterium]|nr:efflux RND transporter permease subunit [Myxococcales bacterium]